MIVFKISLEHSLLATFLASFISFINKDNGNIVKKTTVTLTKEVVKKVLFHAYFFPKVFPIIIFVIILSKTKIIDTLTYILEFALITSEKINNAFVIVVKTMINWIQFLFN